MNEWFEDESFWITMYPVLFTDERFEAAEEEIEKILALIDFQGSSVLDLCCGPGRHSLALAKRGFSVTGVDRTSFLLEKARERAKASKLDVELLQEDMRDYVNPDAYDLVLSMFTSFGYFDEKEDDITVLHNIYQSLKTGGILLIDVMGKERLARIFQPTVSEVTPDGTVFVQRREIFDEWTRTRNEWILIKEGTAKTFRFHHTIYSGQELKDRLSQVGFQEIRLLGDLDGTEYGLDARRLIAVAKKGN
jgi:SAM-dependent methyltransferase